MAGPFLFRNAVFRPLFHSLELSSPKAKYRGYPRLFSTSRSYAQPRYSRFDGRSQAYYNTNLLQSPRFRIIAGILGIGGGLFYITHLETVPISGRRRFRWVPEDVLRQQSENEFQMMINQFRNNIISPRDPRYQEALKVMQRLIPHANLPDLNWRLTVVQEKVPNAFVMPGGQVFVFTGILPITQNEDGLAAVLSHEVAHVVAQHAAEMASKSGIGSLIAMGVAAFLGLPLDLGATGYSLLIGLPGGRQQESEADHIGLLLMSEACYDPSEAERLWERMEKADKTRIPQFLTTHPSENEDQGMRLSGGFPIADARR